MYIEFKLGDISYKGTVSTVQKEHGTEYFFDLGERLQFTIRHCGHTAWETDNPDIEFELVQAAGEQVEKIESHGKDTSFNEANQDGSPDGHSPVNDARIEGTENFPSY
ncbi:MAG: hypothetical protein ABI581_02985 [Sediminibacterium sp.]